MKKCLSAILAMILAVCLISCAHKNENENPTTTTAESSSHSISESTEQTTEHTTAAAHEYIKVPYAEVSYSHILLNGKEISYYNILSYKTISSIVPQRTIYADGEAIFVSKHMINHHDEIPVYGIASGDKFEIENVGNSEMTYRGVLDSEGNEVECDFDKLWELPKGEYYLSFYLVEKANEFLFADTQDEGMYYVETVNCSYIIIDVK